MKKIKNFIIRKNEADANLVAAKILRITFYVFSLIYLLNLLNIFIIPKVTMTISYVSSGIVLLLPTLLNKIVGKDNKALKYVYVSLTSLYVFIVASTLVYHVVMIYVFSIALAQVYFYKKVTVIALLETIVATVAGEMLAFYLGKFPGILFADTNFPTLPEMLLFCALPRLLVMLSFSALLLFLTSRTSKLLMEAADDYSRMVSFNKDMVYGFATLVENRDHSTGSHVKRTSLYVKLLVQELKRNNLYPTEITEDFANQISQAAPLHDIGKISIPDSILQKPGKLTDEEYSIMKTHSEKGSVIIKDTFTHIKDEKFKLMCYNVARYHHEKWNGKGYPEGLTEKNIPLEARIMAIADVFDAVSEKRCYRDAMTMDQSFDIIKNGREKDFDPVLVDSFLNIRDQIEEVHKNTISETA